LDDLLNFIMRVKNVYAVQLCTFHPLSHVCASVATCPVLNMVTPGAPVYDYEPLQSSMWNYRLDYCELSTVQFTLHNSLIQRHGGGTY